jgi:hypothetical protein
MLSDACDALAARNMKSKREFLRRPENGRGAA